MLTQAAVVALIQNSAGVVVRSGAELVDMSLGVVEDISDDLAGGSITRDSFATLHATSQLAISRDLDWGQALLRPYMSMSAGATTARFNLGVYLTSVPVRQIEASPLTHTVNGYDILLALASPVGGTYAVDAGTAYLGAVEAILQAQGFTRYLIDQSSATKVLPTSRLWPLDDRTTWLNVVNDLLASIGYQGVWSDWDGQLRVQSYQSPRFRGPEWVYDTSLATSMIGPRRTRERDFFNAPNRWVAVRNNNVDSTPPTEGDGVYTYQNDAIGDTSVAARGGRVITRVMFLDASDQAGLIQAANQSIDADMSDTQTIKVETFPNPLHWHMDRMLVNDPELGPIMDVLGESWTLPLDGGNQSHTWKVLLT